MSLARPSAKLCTRCPYCEHVSPDDSKFCNECGAALHLRPCPHCGAVNDLTLVDHCARCQGDLHPPAPEVPDGAAASEPAPSAPDPAFDDGLPALRPYTGLLPPAAKPLPLWLLGGGVVLMACAAAATYVVYQQQRSAPSERATAVIESVVREALAAPRAAASAAVREPAPLPMEPPSGGLVEVKATAFETPVAEEAPASNPLPRKQAAAPSPAPAEARPSTPSTPSTPSRNTVEPPPPRIGPCTDAVAALGLCNGATDSNTRRP